MAKTEDFKEKKEILDLKRKSDEHFHKAKMEELEYIRETNRLHHEDEMTRGRIKNAEIKKAFDRKQASQYPRKSWN